MIKLFRELLVIVMLGTVSVGAFAQKRDQDKRPIKEPVKVVTNDRKDQRPPPRNDNQQRPKDKPCGDTVVPTRRVIVSFEFRPVRDARLLIEMSRKHDVSD